MSRARRNDPRLSRITEAWDTPADQQQWLLAQQRYSLAASLAEGRTIAEIGCGTGFGLARISPWAKRAVGIDIDEANLRMARRRAPECSFVRGDATALPLADSSVDVLVGLEMIYYVPDQPGFLAEAARVLGPAGQLLLTMPNSGRDFFQRSPFSTHYAGFDELMRLLATAGFDASVYGSHELGLVNPVKERLRRALVVSRLMPRTVQGRSRLKLLANRDMHRLGDLTIDPATAFHGLTPVNRASAAGRFATWVAVAAVTRKGVN